MSDCELCRRERGHLEAEGGPVYRDELWSVYLAPEFAVPGCLVIQLRRHAEGAMGMSDGEAASFGPLLVRVTAAVKEAAHAEKVYVAAFGDLYAHWHVLIAARGPDAAPEHRGPSLLSRVRELADPEGARLVAARVREILAPC